MSSITPSPTCMTDLSKHLIRPIALDFKGQATPKDVKRLDEVSSPDGQARVIRIITESPIFNSKLNQIHSAAESILRSLAIAYRRSNEDDWRQAIQTFRVLCPALSEEESCCAFIPLIRKLFEEENPHLLDRKMMESPFEPILDYILRHND